MLKCEMVFGDVQTWLYTLEWLFHAYCHILLCLVPEHRIIPEKVTILLAQRFLILMKILNFIRLLCISITWFMVPVVVLTIHLYPCMQDGKCSKK